MNSFLDYRQVIGIYQLSREQKLLLKACVLEGKEAIKAWQEWKESVDIETLDDGSNSILSQLYHNLVANQVEDWHMARLKGIYKRTWYNNQLLLKKLQNILEAFQESNIDTIVNTDAAIVTAYCENYSQLAINDFNLLLHPSDRKKAIAILSKLGWSQVEASSSVINEQDLSLKFKDESTTILNLVARIFWIIPQEYTDKQLWENALVHPIADKEVLMLGAIDLFLYLCIRTFYQAQGSNLYFLLSAMIILQKSALGNQNSWNWIDLVTQAQRYQTIIPLRNMLISLRQLFEISFPNWVLPALDQMPVSPQEYLKYRLLTGEKRALLKSMLYKIGNKINPILRVIK